MPDPSILALGRISGPLLSANLLRNGQNLAFHNNTESDNFLYLEVTGKTVGIKTDAPDQELTVNGTTSTRNLIVDNQSELGNLVFNTYRIQNPSGQINLVPNQLLDPKVITEKIATSNLHFSDKLIESVVNNADILIQPNGLGRLEFYTSNVDVQGNLHATGDITFDGDITLGDTNTDNIVINADVSSNLIPDASNQYDLGKADQRWNNVYVKDFISTDVLAQSLVVNEIDYILAQGKIIYVSQEGIDENYGTHQQSTFKTIKHALSQAQVGDQVIIFPGDYTEEFPLTIPSGVSVKGFGIRSVSISPTEATKYNDAFLLNGDTTVEFLTVKNFYYNSALDTGYAFRFAPSAKVVARSPYVHNVTVITQVSNQLTGPYGSLLLNSTDYPGSGLGLSFSTYTVQIPKAPLPVNFNTIAQAGTKLATWLVDQNTYDNVYTISSVVTDLIDPTVWLVTVEELFVNLDQGKSFYLFDGNANGIADAGRGILVDGSVVAPDSKEASMLFFSVTLITPDADGITATNGARVEWLNSFTYFAHRGIHLLEGTLGFASLGTKYGAEMRSINSANVYGTYGSVADGASTLAYLIGHNFGYIGTGTNTLNDRSIVVQANEVVEFNNGKIYYDSVDHKGDYRIGKIFYVNQETGQVVFDAQSIDFGAQGNITLESPSSVTIVDRFNVQTGNIRVYDNNIDSINGPINLLGANGTLNLSTDIFVTGNLGVSGDITVDGNVYLGDQPFNDTVSVVAKVTSDLLPNQTDFYNVGSDQLRWRNSFFKLLDVDGVSRLSNSTIETLTTNTDLTLQAAGTGIVNVTTTNVQVNNDLTVGTGSLFYAESVTTTASADTLDTGVVVISNNAITTKNDNDLELRAPTGQVISVALNNVEIDNDLTNNLTSIFKNTIVSGNIVHYGNYNLTGDKVQTGSAQVSANLSVSGTTQLYDINISNNEVKTTLTNSNLLVAAQLGGNVTISPNDVAIQNKLTVLSTAYLDSILNTSTITSDTFTTGNIVIANNSITTSTNSDLILLAAGVGEVYVPLTDVRITNNLGVILTSNFNNDVSITGTVNLYGLYDQTGDRNQTGSAIISNDLTVTETAQFNDINITNNVISTTVTNNDLRLAATGNLVVKNADVEISQNLTVGQTVTVNGSTSLRNTTIAGNITLVGDINQTGNLSIIGTFANNNISIPTSLSYFSVPDIKILGNEISVTATNTDLQFTANGNGSIVVDNKIKFTSNNVTNVWAGATTDLQKSLLLSPNGVGNAVVNSTTSLVLPVGSDTTRTLSAAGEVRFNNTTNLFEGYQVAGLVSFKDLYDSDRNTYITSELTPGANDKIIRFGINNDVQATLDSTALTTNTIHTQDTSISGNIIGTRNSLTDLNFVVSGSGEIVVNNVSFQGNKIINNTNGALTLNSTNRGYIKFAGSAGVVIPSGTSEQRRPSPEIGETRWNTDLDNERLETWDGNAWVASIGDTGTLTATGLEEITTFWGIVLG